MKKFLSLLAVLSVAYGFTSAVYAQPPLAPTAAPTVQPIAVSDESTDPYAADRVVLREMLAGVEKAINEKRFTDISGYLNPQANVIFENAEVADGVPAVESFYQRMFSGEGAILKDLKTKATVDQHADFYGDTAVAYGTVVDHFTFTGGMEMDLTSKWQATVVKEGGAWRVVSLQFSANVFDNPVLAAAQHMTKYVGVGALIGGLLVGYALAWIMRRKATVSSVA